jgi:hypothetical protein
VLAMARAEPRWSSAVHSVPTPRSQGG